MKTRSGYAVTEFIKVNTSVKEFYDHVTINETNFNYDINHTGRAGNTALRAACTVQNLPLIKALLEMGANPNVYTGDHTTPLFSSVQSGCLEAVKLLRQHGARLDDWWTNYFDLATESGFLDILDYLTSTQTEYEREALKNDTRPNHSEFIDAIKKGDVTAAKKFLSENFIDFNQVFFGQYSSCRIAAMQGNLEMVKLLIKHGDYIIEDDTSQIPTAQAAREAGHNDIAYFLETTQLERYQRLKAAATKQSEISDITQNKHYQPGLFHEKTSNHLESNNTQSSVEQRIKY